MAQQLAQTPQKKPFPVIGSWNRDTFFEINPEETTNMYMLMPSSSTTSSALVSMPGMRYSFTFSQGTAGRNMYVHKNYLFCVVSEFVYFVDTALNPVIIGTLSTATGHVGISSNDADQVMFVDGAAGWIYSIPDNTFVQITDTNFPVGTTGVDTLNNYFLCFVGEGTSQQWQASALNDGTTWPVDQVGFFQSRPDSGITVAVIKRLILLMGVVSTETWVNPPSGNPIAPAFPFVRDDNILFEYGCAAIGSVIQGLDALFWLSYDEDGPSYIMYCDGSTPRRISTPEIENVISNLELTEVHNASGFIFKINGHEFYQINFASISFVFDLTTQKWFQGGDVGTGSKYLRHPAEAHAFFNGNHYVLAYNTGSMYILDQFYNYFDKTADIRNPIIRQRITPRLFSPSYKQIRVPMFQLIVLTGDQPQNGEFKDPQVQVEVSFDRGKTWLSQQPQLMGPIGTNYMRLTFNRIGVAQEMVFRITSYWPVEFGIIDAAIYIDEIGN